MAENDNSNDPNSESEYANPDDFDNYDDVDAAIVEGEMPDDDFDESAADFDEEAND